MSNCSDGEPFESDLTPPNGKRLVTPEEQYVQCMDPVYAAADRETCLKMMRKAEGVLRGELGARQQAMALTSERWLAKQKPKENQCSNGF